MNTNIIELLKPTYNFEIEHPILDGVVKFTIEVVEFGLAEYALEQYQLDDTTLIEVDDVDTCIFNIVNCTYVNNDTGVNTDITSDKRIQSLIQDKCWCMIVEHVLPDYILLFDNQD